MTLQSSFYRCCSVCQHDILSQVQNNNSVLFCSVKLQATKSERHFPCSLSQIVNWTEQTGATCTCVVLVASLLWVVCGYQVLKELLQTTMTQTRKVSGIIRQRRDFHPGVLFLKDPNLTQNEMFVQNPTSFKCVVSLNIRFKLRHLQNG